MANPRIVTNPFTKHEQRVGRNTGSTKWVAAGPCTIARKNVDITTQTSECTSQEFALSSDVKDVTPETHAPSSMRDETKPLPPKPSGLRNKVSHRDTPLSAIQLIDSSILEQSLKEWDVTVFPNCPALIEKSDSEIKSSWRNQATRVDQTQFQQQDISSLIPCYRAAKQIYDIGPKGEGQKVWEAYQQARSQRQADSKPLRNTPSESMNQERNIEPLCPPSLTSLDGVLFPPLRPRSPQTRRGGKGKELSSPDLRRDSGFSCSSREVPITTGKSIRRTVDTNKPLPLIPKLDVAPKARRTKDRSSGDSRQHPEKEATHTWWKHSPPKAPHILKSKISHPGPLMASNQGITVNIAAECGGVGGPAAAVSLPVTRTGAPLHRPPSMEEKKKEAGRPSPRAFHLPMVHLSPSNNKSKGTEKVKVDESDDTYPTLWRDKLVGPAYEAGKSLKQTTMKKLDGVHVGRKMRTSDVSFACQGIGDEKLDRYQVSEQSSSEEEKDMVPKPLFYVKSTGTNMKNPISSASRL